MKHTKLKTPLAAIFLALGLLGLARGTAAQTVTLRNVEELYSAVNDPANQGATLNLAPGVYTLSVNDPNAIPASKPRPSRTSGKYVAAWDGQ